MSGKQRPTETNEFWIGGYTDNPDHLPTQITDTHANNHENSEYNLIDIPDKQLYFISYTSSCRSATFITWCRNM